MKKVEELMTTTVETCRAQDSLNAAAKIMWDQDCGFVPVIDEHGHVQGVITDRDICMAAYTRGDALAGIPVGDVMSKKIYAVKPVDPVSTAERLMSEAQVRRLPVTDAENRLVGVLSLADLVREAEREKLAGKRDVVPNEIATTLARITAPTHPIPATGG